MGLYMINICAIKAKQHWARFYSQTTVFLTGHSVARYLRSLATLTPLTHYAAICFAPLALLARSIHGLAHLAHSLVGQLKFLSMCSCCKRFSQEQTRFWSSLETRPLSILRNTVCIERWMCACVQKFTCVCVYVYLDGCL